MQQCRLSGKYCWLADLRTIQIESQGPVGHALMPLANTVRASSPTKGANKNQRSQTRGASHLQCENTSDEQLPRKYRPPSLQISPVFLCLPKTNAKGSHPHPNEIFEQGAIDSHRFCHASAARLLTDAGQSLDVAVLDGGQAPNPPRLKAERPGHFLGA